MSLALLHALARPVSLRAMGLGRAAQLALTLTAASRKRCLLNGITVWEAMAVRCCSGPTTFRQTTFIAAAEEDPEKDIMAPNSLLKAQESESYSTATDENLLPSQKERYQSDLLVSKIKECESAAAALEVYRRHREVMDARHCLALIGRLVEVSSSTEDQRQLMKDEDFESLCGQLFKQCRRMEVEESIHLLKQLCLLHVPSTSKLTQAVLQMLKNQINDLSLKQLIFLEFLLKKLTLTPLSDALLTAIPILIGNALTSSSQGKDLTFTELTKAFTTCCKGKVKGTGILLQEMYQRGSVRSATLAMSLVWTLTALSSPRLQRRLLTPEEMLTREVIMKECLETLAREADSLSHQQMESTHSKVCAGYDLRDRSCYNERFLHAVASYFVRHSLTFETAVHAISKMMKMNYYSDELVRYTMGLMLARPDEVPESRVPMLPLISAITAMPLPPHKIKEALDVVMTHKSLRLDGEYYRKPLLVMAQDLLSAGYYHPQLMDILTSPDTLSMYMSKYPKDDNNQRKLLEMDQALGELMQAPHRVPEAFLEPGRKIVANQPPSRSSLKVMLSRILHDATHFMSGVVTDGGMYIDHLLVLDAEGVPITLKSPEASLVRNPAIASLNLPHDATKIAILDIGSGGALRPTSMLKGSHRVRQLVLEASGFKVVPLLQAVIFQHHDEEKILYVKRELNEAGVTVT